MLAAVAVFSGLLLLPAQAEEGAQRAVAKLDQILRILQQDTVREVPEASLAQAGSLGLRQELGRRGLDVDFLAGPSGLEAQFDQACQRYPQLCQDGTLLSACVTGMAVSLQDPYATYMTESTYSAVLKRLGGQEQGGPGLSVVKDHPGEPVAVLESLPGAPEACARLGPGDHIVAIDGNPTVEMNVEDARGRLQGMPGSPLVLKVQHLDASVEEIHIVRAALDQQTVDSHLIQQREYRVGYLRVRSFGARTAIELEQGLRGLTQDGAQAFILDLRNNGGGLLPAAVDVCSKFVPEGTQIVTVCRRLRPEVYRAEAGSKIAKPLVVLLNQNSASAAEITAGAIHDLKLGTLVGSRSFGKGSVQRFVPLGDGSGLKFTSALYRTPAGQPINGQGIVPDILVDADLGAPLGGTQDMQLAQGVNVVVTRLNSNQLQP